MCGNVVCKVAACELLDILSRSQNCMSQRGVLEGCGMQVVKNHLLWNALNLKVTIELTAPPPQESTEHTRGSFLLLSCLYGACAGLATLSIRHCCMG